MASSMAPAVSSLGFLDIHQSDIRLVDQGRGLKGLSRFLVRQLGRREFPQLVIYERQQVFRGVWITLFNPR